MTQREYSKLQVRAEVLAVIQQLSALDETSRENQVRQIKRLRTIQNVDYILECLLRELPKGNYDQKQIIAQLLLEFGSLEKLEKPLWAIIKDPNQPDIIKDVANVILRNLGDTSDPDLYLSYLKDPHELIDKETERMLKVASLNPEAQIDFLDFLFSLPPKEQLNLINSLKDDYPGEYLTCIFMPAIEANLQDETIKTLIEALGNTKSSRALAFLEEIYPYANNDIKKKTLKKSINLLKLSGAKTEDVKDYYKELLSESKLFKCYVSSIDGIGNQAIIISRIKENGDISLFSVVVNDIQGIMDCFGFNQITKTDFDRVVKKFNDGEEREDISPYYCYYRLKISQEINRILDMPLPYEYSAWRALAYDIENFTEDLDELVESLKDESLINNTHILYTCQDFYCWFFEDEDHPTILEFFENCLAYFIENLEKYSNSPEEFSQYFESEINNSIDKIFDDSWRELYYSRLKNQAYILNLRNMTNEAVLASTIAWALKNPNICVKDISFIVKLIQKSMVEFFLRFQYKLDDSVATSKYKIPDNQVSIFKNLLDELFTIWQVDF
ncbi:MAG: hypothetical protein AB1782_05170 [Cyanobacteriota bacterium]